MYRAMQPGLPRTYNTIYYHPYARLVTNSLTLVGWSSYIFHTQYLETFARLLQNRFQ